jgi:hypothetical protein
MQTKTPVWITGIQLEPGSNSPSEQKESQLVVTCDTIAGMEQANDRSQKFILRTGKGHTLFVDLTGGGNECHRPNYVAPMPVPDSMSMA